MESLTDEPEFTLANEPAKLKPRRPENQPARQLALISGLDALPGQQDLFDGLDRE